MLPQVLKSNFEKFRRELSASERVDLDGLALTLIRWKRSQSGTGGYLASLGRALAGAAPALSLQERTALAFYTACLLCDPSAPSTVNGLAGANASNLATQQMTAMQEMQQTLNLQYMTLQEETQQQYQLLSSLRNLLRNRTTHIIQAVLEQRRKIAA